MARALIGATTLAILAVPTAAQDTPPDLSGYWGPTFVAGEPDEDLLARMPANTVLVEDTGVAEFPRGDYGGLTLLEPVLILSMGFIIAVIIIAILMGILSVNDLAV